MLKRTLGINLRAMRERMGISQQQLADRVGLTRLQIARIESGEQGTTIDRLGDLAEALGISPAELLHSEKEAVPIEYWFDRYPPEIREWLRNNPNALQWVMLGKKGLENKDTMDVVEQVIRMIRSAMETD